MQEIKQPKQASGNASGNLPEPSGMRVKCKMTKQASGNASGNLPGPSGTRVKMDSRFLKELQ